MTLDTEFYFMYQKLADVDQSMDRAYVKREGL